MASKEDIRPGGLGDPTMADDETQKICKMVSQVFPDTYNNNNNNNYYYYYNNYNYNFCL